MKRRLRVARIRPRPATKAIKYESDLQLDWKKLIPEVKNCKIESVEFLTISGDAPKDFTTDREYRPGYRSRQRPTDRFIAKVGSKYYPLESIIEQFITRIGQVFSLKIADSKLRIIEGQVRFLSKYFLRSGEQLTHGAEIYEYSLGKENYQELSDQKREAEFFTFQMTCETIHELFPDEARAIIARYVEMVTFDALIGHNDRHPYNWGVIVPIRKASRSRFAPVFDTARALFWNIPESRVVSMLSDSNAFKAYVSKCSPPIGWDGRQKVGFFELIGLMWSECAEYRAQIEKYLDGDLIEAVCAVLDREFGNLLSENRRELIRRCLHHRQETLVAEVDRFKKV
jgi:hypothetical protein